MNTTRKHKVYISFQASDCTNYQQKLMQLNSDHEIFVNFLAGKDDCNINDQSPIRKQWLTWSTVTILLVGKNIRQNEAINTELKKVFKNKPKQPKKGILCISLPETHDNWNVDTYNLAQKYENLVMKINDKREWNDLDNNVEAQLAKHPDFPELAIRNIIQDGVRIDVITWESLFSHGEQQASEWLRQLIDKAFSNKRGNDYIS